MLTAMGFEVFAEGRLIGLAGSNMLEIIDGCKTASRSSGCLWVSWWPIRGRNLNRVLFVPIGIFVLYLTNIIPHSGAGHHPGACAGAFSDITQRLLHHGHFLSGGVRDVGGLGELRGERTIFRRSWTIASNGGTLAGGPDERLVRIADGTIPGNAGEPALS